MTCDPAPPPDPDGPPLDTAWLAAQATRDRVAELLAVARFAPGDPHENAARLRAYLDSLTGAPSVAAWRTVRRHLEAWLDAADQIRRMAAARLPGVTDPEIQTAMTQPFTNPPAAPWSQPGADIIGDVQRAVRGPEMTAAAGAMCRDYAARTGLPVTVFTAAAPVGAGRLVILLDAATVMRHNPLTPGDMGHGVALADAAAGGLVPVVLSAGGVSLAADPETGQVNVTVSGPAAARAEATFGIADAAFAQPPTATGAAEQDVTADALERGEDPYEALAAYRRRPGPLENLPGGMNLVVAPGPGPARQAWRMTAVGVWFALYGEDAAWFLPEGDPARPERMTAAQLRARLAAP